MGRFDSDSIWNQFGDVVAEAVRRSQRSRSTARVSRIVPGGALVIMATERRDHFSVEWLAPGDVWGELVVEMSPGRSAITLDPPLPRLGRGESRLRPDPNKLA